MRRRQPMCNSMQAYEFVLLFCICSSSHFRPPEFFLLRLSRALSELLSGLVYLVIDWIFMNFQITRDLRAVFIHIQTWEDLGNAQLKLYIYIYSSWIPWFWSLRALHCETTLELDPSASARRQHCSCFSNIFRNVEISFKLPLLNVTLIYCTMKSNLAFAPTIIHADLWCWGHRCNFGAWSILRLLPGKNFDAVTYWSNILDWKDWNRRNKIRPHSLPWQAGLLPQCWCTAHWCHAPWLSKAKPDGKGKTVPRYSNWTFSKKSQGKLLSTNTQLVIATFK